MGNSICASLKRQSRDSIGTKMASSKISAEIIDASVKHTSTLIFLHGLGDNGTGWATTLKSFVPKHCKIVCPHAKEKPVTLNNGIEMPSWFDIIGLAPNSPQDEAGIKAASKELSHIVNKEIENGIAPNRIVIGGFSQGGALALYNALTGPVNRFAGVLALSTWLPLHSAFQNNPSLITIDKSTPVIQCHGEMDPLVPMDMGRISNSFLKMLGLTDIEFKAYKYMMHSSCDEELKDLSTFLNKVLHD